MNQKRRVFGKRRPPRRWKQAWSGLAFLALSAGLLVGLMQVSERLDTLLLVSTAIANLISGLSRFVGGLLQLLGVLLLVLIAIGALVLLAAGVMRLIRALLPGTNPSTKQQRRRN